MNKRSFRILTSNSLNALMIALAKELQQNPLPPLEQEVIVIQSQGMRRWVTLRLAEQLGCAASLHMPFPGTFSRQLAERLSGNGEKGSGGEEDSLFTREVLTWRILGIIDDVAAQKRFQALANYLADNDPRKRYQLCARIANCFDDYQIYRPEVLLAWEAGDQTAEKERHADWQAAIWRRLCEGIKGDHLARRFDELIRDLNQRKEPPASLPMRLAVFGVNTLPPVFLDLLRALSRFIPVTLYLVAPARQTGALGTNGNPLLNSLAAQGQEFLSLVKEKAGEAGEWRELEFVNPGTDSVLHAIQSDILNGIDRGRGDTKPLPLEEADNSFQIHDCHSPQREMEALRDQLLAEFASDPALRPHDVLMMVTDMQAYAPYIQSVFGVEQRGTPALPYRIADQPLSREQPTAEAFLQILRLAQGRLECTDVLDVLAYPAVRNAFEFAESDLAIIHNWVRTVNICWGADGRQRKETYDLPAEEANTWRAGLDRLLMGYSVGNLEYLVAGVLPSGNATSSRSELLGRFVEWVDQLFTMLNDLRRPRPLAQWAETLRRLIDVFLAPTEKEEEQTLFILQESVGRLARLQELSRFAAEVELGVLLDYFDAVLADDGFGTGFISGRITFCAMKPMRTIPFPVIAICGLNNDRFPRRDWKPAFNLQNIRMPGDRSLRGDDRQLIFDSLLAAQKRLILTYVGRSQKDNSQRAPSVCLSELLDYVEQGFAGAKKQVVIQHHLQPFNAAYFDGSDPRLFSYARENCGAGKAALENRRQTGRFLKEPLPPSQEELQLDLRDLVRFWTNPCEHFCRRTLNLRLDGQEEELEDVEPTTVSALNQYQTAEWIVRRRLGGAGDEEKEQQLLAARCDLPPGYLCAACHKRLMAETVQPFLRRVGSPKLLVPIGFTLPVKTWTLVGELDMLTATNRCQFRCATLKPKDKIRAWITHVAMNAYAQAGGKVPHETRLVGTNEEMTFSMVDKAGTLLEDLVAGYEEGLRAPPPLFERTSHAFMEHKMNLEGGKSRSRRPPMAVAGDAWFGGKWDSENKPPPERDDPYIALCFRGRDPLEGETEDFQRWAERLWTPLLQNCKGGGA
jgi:exodeoxyribonuclease V gamma subunit